MRGRQGGSYASSWRILPTSRVVRLLRRVPKIHGGLSDPLRSRLDVWTSLSRRQDRYVPDVRADPDYVVLDRQFNVRTALGVPLLREGTPIGVIILQRSTVRPLTDKQIELVTTFADQAVIAIENVRLFDEVQARTRE